MSDKRRKLSGSGYRKIANEKREKETNLLKTIKKVDSFFKPLEKSNESGLSGEGCSSWEQYKVTDSGSNNENNDQATSAPETDNFILSGDNELSSDSTQISKSSNVSVSQQSDINFIVSDDPIEWKINDTTIEVLLHRGINQNKDCDFKNSKRDSGNKTRYLNKQIFSRKLQNGELISRDYLVYSKSTGSVFCASCRLFGSQKTCSKLASEGVSDWKNIGAILSAHESSQEHINSELALLTRKRRIGTLDSNDSQYDSNVETERKYWKHVLERVFAVVKKLASRGRPFRGSDETFGSLHNGEYMMSLELVAEFDPFLAEHIRKFGNPGSGKTSYLSSFICNEVIVLLASKVRDIIINEVKQAKYYSIIVDSTPDISHTDQLSFVLRFVQENGNPVERFLMFLPNTGHKSEDLANAVMAVLRSNSIDLADCRGQSYDNASNMSGVYSGLQARIKDENPKALFVPCSAHSLNLVGTCAASCCPEACAFFNLIQNVYNFFVASTNRWETLVTFSQPESKTLKGLSETRWSARESACKGLCENLDGVMLALKNYEENTNEKPLVRSEATGLLRSLNRLETVFMMELWSDILDRFEQVSQTLQKIETSIERVVRLYDSLVLFIDSLRDMFPAYEERAKKQCDLDYETCYKRQKKRKFQADENKETEVLLEGRDKFRVETFYVVLDQLKSELQKRKNAYGEIADKFSVFNDLSSSSTETIIERANKLHSFYDIDLEKSFSNECVHFSCLLKSSGIRNNPLVMMKYIREEQLQSTFPNIDIALRMYLCTAVSNCSAERSFSVLKRIKSCLRSRMNEDKLNSLAILHIEAELLNSDKMKVEDLIEEFSIMKSRRKPL